MDKKLIHFSLCHFIVPDWLVCLFGRELLAHRFHLWQINVEKIKAHLISSNNLLCWSVATSQLTALLLLTLHTSHINICSDSTNNDPSFPFRSNNEDTHIGVDEPRSLKKSQTLLHRKVRKASIACTVISEPHRKTGHLLQNIIKSIQLSALWEALFTLYKGYRTAVVSFFSKSRLFCIYCVFRRTRLEWISNRFFGCVWVRHKRQKAERRDASEKKKSKKMPWLDFKTWLWRHLKVQVTHQTQYKNLSLQYKTGTERTLQKSSTFLLFFFF